MCSSFYVIIFTGLFLDFLTSHCLSEWGEYKCLFVFYKDLYNDQEEHIFREIRKSFQKVKKVSD